MGNNQSSGNAAGGAAPAGAGAGAHRRSGSRSQQSPAAASLSTFQNQASIHRLRQHQQRQQSSKSTATQSSTASRGSGASGARRSRSSSPSGKGTNLDTPSSINDPYKAQTPLSPGEKATSPSSITSTSTAGGGGGSGPRRRKSIELPDLDPSLAFTNATHSGSSAATPLADINMTSRGGGANFPAGKRQLGDLSAFKLRLPDKQRVRLLDAASSAGSTSSTATEAQMRSGIEAMRLDEGEDHPGDGPAGMKSAASTSTHAQHIAPSAPIHKSSAFAESTLRPTTGSFATADDSRDTSGAATPQEQYAKVAPPEIEIEGTSAASPSAIAPDTDAVPIGISQAPYPFATSPSVLIPLQQPIETVVPPLPPTIMKPFPPPLPVAPVSSGSSAAAVHKVAAATEAVRQAPALDVGAGPEGVPTLIVFKEPANEVYVTGTFCRWKQQIRLRKDPEAPDQTDFSALVSLSPGPHRLKFIVDKKWKTSKYLPTATDAAGNLINYLQVEPGDQPFRGLGPRGMWSGYTYGNWSLGMAGTTPTAAGTAVLDPTDSEWHENDDDWTNDIPVQLLEYEDVFDHVDSDDGEIRPPPDVMPGPGEKGYSTEPPKLPAQLTQGILNMGSKGLESVTDDNSLLPKPDHSVLNHLAASPIKHGLLSVGVTTRYKRKYLTTVLYKRLDSA